MAHHEQPPQNPEDHRKDSELPTAPPEVDAIVLPEAVAKPSPYGDGPPRIAYPRARAETPGEAPQSVSLEFDVSASLANATQSERQSRRRRSTGRGLGSRAVTKGTEVDVGSSTSGSPTESHPAPKPEATPARSGPIEISITDRLKPVPVDVKAHAVKSPDAPEAAGDADTDKKTASHAKSVSRFIKRAAKKVQKAYNASDDWAIEKAVRHNEKRQQKAEEKDWAKIEKADKKVRAKAEKAEAMRQAEEVARVVAQGHADAAAEKARVAAAESGELHEHQAKYDERLKKVRINEMLRALPGASGESLGAHIPITPEMTEDSRVELEKGSKAWKLAVIEAKRQKEAADIAAFTNAITELQVYQQTKDLHELEERRGLVSYELAVETDPARRASLVAELQDLDNTFTAFSHLPSYKAFQEESGYQKWLLDSGKTDSLDNITEYRTERQEQLDNAFEDTVDEQDLRDYRAYLNEWEIPESRLSFEDWNSEGLVLQEAGKTRDGKEVKEKRVGIRYNPNKPELPAHTVDPVTKEVKIRPPKLAPYNNHPKFGEPGALQAILGDRDTLHGHPGDAVRLEMIDSWDLDELQARLDEAQMRIHGETFDITGPRLTGAASWDPKRRKQHAKALKKHRGY